MATSKREEAQSWSGSVFREPFPCAIGGVSSLIEDEKFDFDVPLSPIDFHVREHNADLEDEDEVFFGPVGHRERCVTVNSELQDDDKFKPLSPLNGEQIAELFKEATAVSIFIKNSSFTQNNDYVTDGKENHDICELLSQTFTVEDNHKNVTAKGELEDNKRTTKSASSPESANSISPQSTECSDDMNIPVTPTRILQESNSQSRVFQSPFKGRKARPLQNSAKFAQSKLPTTQMTLKTRSCFNSPIKVEHLYGLRQTMGGSEKEKIPRVSQSGIKPPGFGCKPRRRRTSSSSSVSSTSSAVSVQSSDMNETFVISKGSSSDISSIPTACARKVPATKVCLKPVNGSGALTKPTFTKPKGRPQPVKALPQPVTHSKKASPTPTDPLKSKRVPSNTPVRRQSEMCSERMVTRSQTPNNIQRSKSFNTPVRQSRSNTPTGQAVRRRAQTPIKGKSPTMPLTPRQRGSVTPRASASNVQTSLQRHNSGTMAAISSKAQDKNASPPSTPQNAIYASNDKVTPPNPVPSNTTKRKSLSANSQKRRSLLPTPLKSRITRSQSQKYRSKSINNVPPDPLTFGFSPSAEVKPRSFASQPDPNVQLLHSHTRISDPFSPASQLVTTDPISDNTNDDSVARNLIEWSPAVSREGNLIDI